jgi:hypothetical protein
MVKNDIIKMKYYKDNLLHEMYVTLKVKILHVNFPNMVESIAVFTKTFFFY